MPDPSQLEEEYTRYLAALQVIKGESYIFFVSGAGIKSWESCFSLFDFFFQKSHLFPEFIENIPNIFEMGGFMIF